MAPAMTAPLRSHCVAERLRAVEEAAADAGQRLAHDGRAGRASDRRSAAATRPRAAAETTLTNSVADVAVLPAASIALAVSCTVLPTAEAGAV